ncbi:MAG: tetratricopeptide repeat protein [bacterium]
MTKKIIVLVLILTLITCFNITWAEKDKLLSIDEKEVMMDKARSREHGAKSIEQGAKKEIEELKKQRIEKPLSPKPEIELVNGIKFANQKKYDEAIQIFESIIKKYPDTKASNQSKFMIDKINEEKRKNALLSQPKPTPQIEIPKEYYPNYQFNLGIKYYRERNFKEALACFQKVVDTAQADSKLAKEAEMAIEKIQRILTPKPEPEPIPHFKISDEKRKQIQKEWYERTIQHQQELFDKALELKEEGKLQEALKVLEELMDSRSSPVLDKAAKEMSKIQEDLGLLEQIEKSPKNIELGVRKLSYDELPEFEKKIRAGELKVKPREKAK